MANFGRASRCPKWGGGGTNNSTLSGMSSAGDGVGMLVRPIARDQTCMGKQNLVAPVCS